MKGGIFLIQDNEQLIEMKESPYDSEDLLQSLLEKYPDLLAGEQINSAKPRRWLLVSREVPVPMKEDTIGSLAVDHLFLDQDGIPTFVEVKRSSDTRIRREVIGQMLDYTANAVLYLSPDNLRAYFETSCQNRGIEPELELTDFLEQDTDPDTFWKTVMTNLQAGRIRMLFVADIIPPELRRIVEFLNGQMNPAEVLAVEIKQYAGPGFRTLVPRVVGKTAEAERSKGEVRPQKQWDEASFFADLEARFDYEDANVARDILNWAKMKMPEIWWGKGIKHGSFIPGLTHKGNWYQVIGIWTNGYVEMQFQYMRTDPPFDNDMKRVELLGRINKIPGVSISAESVNRRPSFPLSILRDKHSLQQFFEALNWVVAEIKAT